jgi:hypothetical protein
VIRSHIVSRPSLVVGALVAVGWGLGVTTTPAVAMEGLSEQAARDTVADTIRTGEDTVRQQVLDRLRQGARSAARDVDADTLLPPDTVSPLDTARVDGHRPTVVVTRENDARRPRPATELPPDADSIMRALARLPGYSVAAYQGTRADFEAAERRLVLTGTPEERARFSGQGNRVEADSSITYDDRTRRVRTTGPSLFTPEQGDPVESRALIYDVDASRGTAREARTTYTEAATWYVQGNLDSVEQGRLFGSGARFTSCDHDPPHSHFHASELKVVANQVLVARGVRMYVEDVPVMWLPFIAQNLGSGRASGLLTPAFSMNDVVRTSSGSNRRLSNIGYYWAMSDYSDMTVAMDWFSNNYTALTAGVRYRWRQQFLDGNVNLKRYWRDTGRRELALDTRHNWDISERTRANVSARYITSSDFVAENSFDPRELTQTIDSNAGLSHRFNWGSLSMTANRRQHLSDDRIDMTLPNASLSLNTITLFPAPPTRASWYNNLSLSGSARFNRDVFQRATQPDTAFVISRADETRTRASMSSSLGLGDFSLSGSVDLSESVFQDVPVGLLGQTWSPGSASLVRSMGGFSTGDGLPPAMDPMLQGDLLDDPFLRDDFAQASVTWQTGLSYRLNLIGSTTFTPNVSVSGELQRSDTIPEALSFVSGPQRVSAGARLQTDLYGFYPGFGRFDGIRHKVSPSVTFQFAPEVTPTELQRRVFGARGAQPRKVLTFGFNQTWEARIDEEEVEEPAPEEAEELVEEDPEALLPLPGTADEAEFDPEDEEEVLPPARRTRDDGPRRAPRSQVMTLLALQTTSVTYDLVEADSTGEFLRGFQTTRIQNTVRSDFLRGLSFSFEHDLFEDVQPGTEPGVNGPTRRFAPHLSRLNLGFQVDHRSGAVRALGRLLGVGAPDAVDDEPEPEEDPDEEELTPRPDGFDPNRIVPGGTRRNGAERRGAGWSARFQYALQRPRDVAPTAGRFGGRNQMLQWNLSFAPSQNWDATWQTSYDLELNRFNDHMVQLRRDLHEWEATFGFRQAANGNWSFQFEVALRANRDLSFDYEQRNLEGGRGTGAGLPPTF